MSVPRLASNKTLENYRAVPLVVVKIEVSYGSEREETATRRRADERTRTADLISLRVISQALQGFAGCCKSPIFRAFSLLRFALCCTVLRSRWYQSGVKSSWIMVVGSFANQVRD